MPHASKTDPQTASPAGTPGEAGSPASLAEGRYRNPAMESLVRQSIKFTPQKTRQQQIDRAEEFLLDVDPEKQYAWPEICRQVTDYKSEAYPNLVISGPDVQHDLRRLIEDLSGSVLQSVEDVGEPVLTVKEVSEQYQVSTKTVDRWRDRGLPSRRFLIGKRERVGFLQSSVERFAEQNPDQVNRGGNFSQLSKHEKERIVERAMVLARDGYSESEVARTVSGEMDRAPETIRYTIKNHDKAHPEAAVFPDSREVLTREQRQEIYRLSRQGKSPETLAKKFHRSKSTISRIVVEERASLLLEQPLEYIDSDEFRLENADELIFAEPPPRNDEGEKVRVPPDLPFYMKSLYSIPLLTKDEEQYYFRRMNYLKFKAEEARQTLSEGRPKAKVLSQIEAWAEEASQLREFLTRSNLRLVVSIAKKHVSPVATFHEIVSDGNVSLMRAVEKFDYSRGFKFSTYASWAVMKNFARSIPQAYKHQKRYRTGTDELFLGHEEGRANPQEAVRENAVQHKVIMDMVKSLDPRERQIVLMRYGIAEHGERVEPMTLEQIGEQFGVTKERIRQLEKRAIEKLKKMTDGGGLDIPGFA